MIRDYFIDYEEAINGEFKIRLDKFDDMNIQIRVSYESPELRFKEQLSTKIRCKDITLPHITEREYTEALTYINEFKDVIYSRVSNRLTVENDILKPAVDNVEAKENAAKKII